MINKDSLPYLYTTETSGIRVLEKGQNKEYGVSVPINKSKSDNYLLGALQLFLKYDQFKESMVPQVMFSLLHGNGVVEFLINTDQTLKRFKITARDQLTRSEYPGISFHQNGIKITNPYLSKNEWNVISVLFDDPIDLSSQSGSINLLSWMYLQQHLLLQIEQVLINLV